MRRSRCSDASGDFGTQQMEVAGIPGKDVIGARLYGASRDERIIDSASDDPVRSGISNSCHVDIALKTYEAEPAANAVQELDRLVW